MGWIASAIKRPGQLHRDLGVPQGKNIPVESVRAAAKAKGKLGQRARLALTLRGFRKSKKTKEAGISAALDRAAEAIIREADRLVEEWSDAARAASIAARQGRWRGRRRRSGVVPPGRRMRAEQPERREPDKPPPPQDAKPEPEKPGAPAETPSPQPAKIKVKREPLKPGEEAPEDRPGDHELEGVRDQMGRDERDALDAGYEKAKAKGFKGNRASYIHDVGRRYETEPENESTAETWLSGDTVKRLRKITKQTGEARRMERAVDDLLRESDQSLFGTDDYDAILRTLRG